MKCVSKAKERCSKGYRLYNIDIANMIIFIHHKHGSSKKNNNRYWKRQYQIINPSSANMIVTMMSNDVTGVGVTRGGNWLRYPYFFWKNDIAVYKVMTCALYKCFELFPNLNLSSELPIPSLWACEKCNLRRCVGAAVLGSLFERFLCFRSPILIISIDNHSL